jgi:flagellar biosynthetic protein FliP
MTRFLAVALLVASPVLAQRANRGAPGAVRHTTSAPQTQTAQQPTAQQPTAPAAKTPVAPAGPTAAAPKTPQTPSAPVAAPSADRADAMVSKLAPQMDMRLGNDKDGGLRLSGTVGVVIMLGLLTLLPTLLLLMTGFTRILIVMNFLRQALGTQSAPPTQLLAALSLIITGFVMAPTFSKINDTAIQPWMDGKIEQVEMMKTAAIPLREFMLAHTRDHDLQVFIDMSAGPQPKNEAEIPLVTLVSAFATSELRTAFQIGFAIFLPFIIIDIVVSSVLMSMGMFMLPPAMISLPFKLLLFVLVDGWTLVIQSLVTSFHV